MRARVVAIGAAIVDRIFRTYGTPCVATSNPATLHRCFGGVARNVAENLARAGVAVALCSAVGDDDDGHALVEHLRDAGCDVSGVRFVSDAPTPEYAAIVGADGELFAAAADTRALDGLSQRDLDAWQPTIDDAEWLFFDCNLPPALAAACVALRENAQWRLAIDATSVAKARTLPSDLSLVDVLFANELEAAALRPCNARAVVVLRGAGGVCIETAGARSAIPALPAPVVNVTGAGDALVAGTLHALLDGKPLEEAARFGVRLAARAVESPLSVARP